MNRKNAVIIISIIVVVVVLGIPEFMNFRIDRIRDKFFSKVNSITKNSLEEFEDIESIRARIRSSSLEQNINYDKLIIRVIMQDEVSSPKDRAQTVIYITKEINELLDKYKKDSGYETIIGAGGFSYHGKARVLYMEQDIRCVYGELECHLGEINSVSYYEWNEKKRHEDRYDVFYDSEGNLTKFAGRRVETSHKTDTVSEEDKLKYQRLWEEAEKRRKEEKEKERFNGNPYPNNDPEDYDDPEDYADDAWEEYFDNWIDAYDYWENY